jgi:hypothetical protein
MAARRHHARRNAFGLRGVDAMKVQRERVRRLMRRSASLDTKIESLAARSSDARRMLAMMHLSRETSRDLTTELQMLGYVVAKDDTPASREKP